MSNTIPSPNMSMPVPVVSVDPGPDWANNINACLSILDQHNHATGQGVQITPSGLLINTDLTILGNNLIAIRSVRFSPQGAPLSLPADLGCLYEVGVDLYYNDGSGNQIRITQSGAIAGAAGTITGLPSGTASASFSPSGGGTFTFLAATATPANFVIGPVSIGRNASGTKFVMLIPNAAQASDYTLVFPPALPAGVDYATIDASGNISFNSSGSTGSGAVVLSTSPTFTGTIAGSFAFSGVLQANGGLQNSAFVNTTTSTAVVLDITFNPHQVFTSLTAATTVNLPTTGVLAGDIWEIENASSTKEITVRASDGTPFTVSNSGANTTIGYRFGQDSPGRVIARALINTPVTVTDWQIIEVIDSGVWSGTTSGDIGAAFTVTFSRINNIVNMNAVSGSASSSSTTSITIGGVPNRLMPFGNNNWSNCVLKSNGQLASGNVQITSSGNNLNFFKYDNGSFSGHTGIGGQVADSAPQGTSFTYNIYNNG